jgi:SAM-dependent methyltransferase
VGQVTGLDINAGMLAVARSLSPGAATTWVEASAAATGLPDDSFDVVLCQQGLQFFPDKSTALKEVRRVLVSGGRAVFSTWKSMGPYYRAVGEALERSLGVAVATKFRSTRVGLPDDVALRRLFIEAGFREVQIRPSTMVVHLPAIEAFVLGHLAGTHVAEALASLSEETRAGLAKQVKIALQPYADAEGFAVPDEANVSIAHK